MSESQQRSKKWNGLSKSQALLQDRKCGYCGYILSGNYNLMKHSCFHPFNEETHLLKVDENFVVTVVSRAYELELNDDLPNNNMQGLDTDELLIYYVSQRRALFDHRTPASDRSTLKKNALWEEICNSLGGVLNITEVKKRWRYLRDCYMKAKRKEHMYIPSGSAAKTSTLKKSFFRFYEQMKFLDDVLGKSLTCTSLPSNVQNNEEDESMLTEVSEDSILVPQPTCSNPSSNVSNLSLSSNSGEIDLNLSKKRKSDRLSKMNNEFHETVITTLRETNKQHDGVDGFLLLLGEGLRKLPYRKRTGLEMKFLAMLMEKQDELINQ